MKDVHSGNLIVPVDERVSEINLILSHHEKGRLTFLRAPRCIAKFIRCIPSLSKDISFVTHVRANTKTKRISLRSKRCQSGADKERLSKRNELNIFISDCRSDLLMTMFSVVINDLQMLENDS